VDVFGSFEKVLPMDGEQDGDDLTTAIFHGTGDREATENMLGVTVITDRD
jgi:hypothetical protein